MKTIKSVFSFKDLENLTGQKTIQSRHVKNPAVFWSKKYQKLTLELII